MKAFSIPRPRGFSSGKKYYKPFSTRTPALFIFWVIVILCIVLLQNILDHGTPLPNASSSSSGTKHKRGTNAGYSVFWLSWKWIAVTDDTSTKIGTGLSPGCSVLHSTVAVAIPIAMSPTSSSIWVESTQLSLKAPAKLLLKRILFVNITTTTATSSSSANNIGTSTISDDSSITSGLPSISYSSASGFGGSTSLATNSNITTISASS